MTDPTARALTLLGLVEGRAAMDRGGALGATRGHTTDPTT